MGWNRPVVSGMAHTCAHTEAPIAAVTKRRRSSLCEKVSSENYFSSAKHNESPSHHGLWCVCGRGKPSPAGEASKVEEGIGDVRQRGKQKKTKNKKQRTSSDEPSNGVGIRVDCSAATAIPRPQAAAQQAAARGTISLSNEHKQHQHQHQLPFLRFSVAVVAYAAAVWSK